MKLKNFKFRAWITEKDLGKIILHTKKPKEKCVEVEVGFVPIKKK